MVCNSCFHRRRDAEGLVNAAEIVVHLVESNRMGEGGEGGKGDRREVSVTLKSPIIVSQTSLVKQISENVPSVPRFLSPDFPDFLSPDFPRFRMKSRISAPRLARRTTHIADRCTAGCPAAPRRRNSRTIVE